MNSNPFEAPKIDAGASVIGDAGEFYADGKNLVVRSGVSLPSRCVYCNREQGQDGKRFDRKLFYASPFIYLLILINLLILALVYLLIRKPVRVSYSLCGDHRRRKFRFAMASLLSLALMIGSFVLSAVLNTSVLGGVGVLFLLAFLVLVVMATRGLMPKKHENGLFWIGGCGPAFLASVPAK